MSSATHVIGFKPPDDKWRKMKDALEACLKAEVDVPLDVRDYFDGDEPDPLGVIVELDRHDAVVHYNEDMAEGRDIHIDKLPKDVKIIRVYTSY